MMYNDRLRVVVDEIRKSINQVIDDANIVPAQVVYWIRIAANNLLAKHIDKRSSGAFLSTFDNIPVLIASTSKPKDFVKGRKFIQLPGQIFDFNEDRGVEYIAYVSDGGPGCPPRFTQVTFQRTTQKQSHWLYKSPYTNPSPSNPYWFRAGNNIYLLGIEKIKVPSLEVGLYMAIDPVEMLDIKYDEPFMFPAELMETLKRTVIDLAKYSYLYPREANVNTGSDNPEPPVSTLPKIQSVNQQNPES